MPPYDYGIGGGRGAEPLRASCGSGGVGDLPLGGLLNTGMRAGKPGRNPNKRAQFMVNQWDC